jgi:hypothetical protein
MTTFATRSPASLRRSRASTSACSRISPAVRFRPSPIVPVAQKVHASGQPDCDDTHTVRRFLCRIATASTGNPSRVSKRILTVPSRERWTSRSASSRSGSASSSRARSDAGSAVISA